MAFTWPVFHLEPLGGARVWTGVFDSYDQHTEDCYYIVRVFEGQTQVAALVAKAPVYGDDWTGPAFREGLRSICAGVAAAGESNTSYRGILGWRTDEPDYRRAAHPFG